MDAVNVKSMFRINSLGDWELYGELQKKKAMAGWRKAYIDFVANMIIEDNTSKTLYSLTKCKKSDGCGVSTVRENNILHSTPRENAEVLNRQLFSCILPKKTTHIFRVWSQHSIRWHRTYLVPVQTKNLEKHSAYARSGCRNETFSTAPELSTG